MDITITGLPTASGIDPAADWFPIDRTSLNTTQKINRNTMLGITGAPVGTTDSQTLTNKTITNPTLTVRDNVFTIQDNLDPTKQTQFQLSGITTATTRTLTVPNANTTIVGTDATQTLTNKTLTAPVITNGSITGTTITTDAIVGQSSANSGTIYGLAVTSGTIAAAGLASNSVTTVKIQDGAVTGSKLATSAITLGYAQTVASQTGFVGTEIAVTGLSVAVTVPSGGRSILITFQIPNWSTSGGTADQYTFKIKESATILQARNVAQGSTFGNGVFLYCVITPSPGAHTYNVTAQRVNGAGTGTTNSDATMISSILVQAI